MIAVLNTRIANASSVLYALENLGYSAKLSQDPEELTRASRVILPGVGTASALMEHIKNGELKQCLLELKVPVLGICLGMQALYDFSEEGNVDCLGVFGGSVKKFVPRVPLPIPHMGWNQVNSLGQSALLRGIPDGTYFYFVHSFVAPFGSETRAETEYGGRVPAVVEGGNWFGTQFHPERSGKAGEVLLKNFLERI